MEAARWERIESLCFDALDMDAATRAAFLDQACRGDAEMRSEVETMLRQLDRDPDFLERPLVDLGALDRRASDAPAEPTDAIGPYRLIRRLGRGGMGDVFLAERRADDVTQKVALKVIRHGRGGAEVLRRFRLERRILASLSHPNIAAFLDASVTQDGRPYFVMEYVDGVPIDQYCDGRRLSLRERLRLFLVTCRAVQHAHGNLVVHRDLKPSNILVTADGVPKLVDFGIGKVLAPDADDARADETHAHVRLLTPEYAAPEQITGAPISTATDTYGLGLLLYVLLTGRHPFTGAGETGHALEKAVLAREPERPSEAVGSGLKRRLAGDLDWVVLKALRKEPERRYASAAALAEDLQRYLDGMPVSARPDTLGYRARKFARRNAGWVAAAAAAFAALTAITAVTLVQSRRVEREAARVAEERDKALEVRSFLMEMFGASGADRLAGDTLTVRRLLDLQAASLETSYADRPELRAEMMEVLADGYDRLGLYQAAEPLARDALELRRSTLPAGHPDVASSLNTYGWVIHELGRTAEAEPLLEEAVRIRRAAGAGQRQNLARSLNDLGVIQTALERYPEATAALTEALGIRRALGSEPRAIGISASNLAAVHYYEGRLEEAVRVQTLALDELRKAVGDDHQRSIIALSNLAAFKRAGGDWEGAIADYRDLAVRQTKLQGRGHLVTTRVLAGLGLTLHQRGSQLDDRAMLEEGETLLRETVENFESIVGPADAQVGVQMYRLALAESALGKQEDAVGTARRALQILRASLGDAHASTAQARSALAVVLSRAGHMDEALELQRTALHALEAASGPTSVETAAAQGTLCDLMLTRGDVEEALPYCAAAAETLRGAPAPERERAGLPMIQVRLARAFLALGRNAAADSMLVEARRTLSSGIKNVRAQRSLDSLSARLTAGG